MTQTRTDRRGQACRNISSAAKSAPMSEEGCMMVTRLGEDGGMSVQCMPDTRADGALGGVEVVDRARGAEILRGEVFDRLGLTLEKFFSELDRGAYDGTEDESVLRLVMLAPFGRAA